MTDAHKAPETNPPADDRFSAALDLVRLDVVERTVRHAADLLNDAARDLREINRDRVAQWIEGRAESLRNEALPEISADIEALEKALRP